MESEKHSEQPEKKLFLLMKRTQRIQGKRMLCLVALDYISGEILTIIDEDGDPYLKLHSWSKEADALREMTVIKARFIFDATQQYLAKALSPIETISKKGNLKQLVKKIYVSSLLSVIEGESNLPFPVSSPDILENADNISIDQSFYNSDLSPQSEEEDMLYDMFWHYEEDDQPEEESFLLSEDDNLRFEWAFDNKKQISFREREYQLIDLSGSVLKEKQLIVNNIKISLADEKDLKDTKQGCYFNGFALIRRSGENFVADKLFGKFEAKKMPLYIDKLNKDFRQLEEHILMAATEDGGENETAFGESEIQYGEIEEFAQTGNGLEEATGGQNKTTEDLKAVYNASEEKSEKRNKKEAILAEISGDHPNYKVIDIYANEFATEYGASLPLRAERKNRRQARPATSINTNTFV